MIRTMAIADILKLPSVDSDGGMGDGNDWSTAAAVECTTFGENDSSIRAEYDVIMAEIEYDGYNRIPLHVDYGYNIERFYHVKIPTDLINNLFMGNGHHRLKMMIILGIEDARVTDDPSESDDTGDEMYVFGYDGPDDDDEYTLW